MRSRYREYTVLVTREQSIEGKLCKVKQCVLTLTFINLNFNSLNQAFFSLARQAVTRAGAEKKSIQTQKHANTHKDESVS